MSDGARASPLTLALRVLAVLAVALHAMVMYVLARDGCGWFGFSLAGCLVSSGFALLMLIPAMWVWILPELPEQWGDWRAISREAQRCCGACGYPRPSHAMHDSRCTECGCQRCESRRPRSFQEFLRRAAILSLTALVLGGVAGESLIQSDESDFVNHVLLENKDILSTARSAWWPSSATLSYWAGDDDTHRFSREWEF